MEPFRSYRPRSGVRLYRLGRRGGGASWLGLLALVVRSVRRIRSWSRVVRR